MTGMMQAHRASHPLSHEGIPRQNATDPPPIAIPGYAPLRVLPAGMGCAGGRAVFRYPIPQQTLHQVHQAGSYSAPGLSMDPRQRALERGNPAPSTTSAPPPSMTSPARSRPPLSDTNRDQVNKRRRELRAHERPYFKEMVAAHAEQR
jgi:hypothetical protein